MSGRGGRTKQGWAPHQPRRVRDSAWPPSANGVAVRWFHPLAALFRPFSDYSPQRHPVLAALMKRAVIQRFTHDSIGLGEDGPRTKPQHAPAPDPESDVWRPADTAETVVAWTAALQNKDKPTALLLSTRTWPTMRAKG